MVGQDCTRAGFQTLDFIGLYFRTPLEIAVELERTGWDLFGLKGRLVSN